MLPRPSALSATDLSLRAVIQCRVHQMALRAFAISALLFAFTAAIAQQSRVLRLPWEHWQMHVGDEPRCAEKALNQVCTEEKFFVDVTRYGIEWNRIEITLPSELSDPQQQLSLVVEGEEPVYQVFLNGDIRSSPGSFEADAGRS